MSDPFLMDRLFRTAIPTVAAGLAALRHSRTLSAGLAIVAALAVWQMPVFPAAPFLRSAFPTTFQMSEMRAQPRFDLRGQEVYDRACAACHGIDACGRGPGATGDPVWPPDLTAPLFWTAR